MNERIKLNKNAHCLDLEIYWDVRFLNGEPVIVWTVWKKSVIDYLNERGLLPEKIKHLILNHYR